MKKGDLVQIKDPADLEEHWEAIGIVLERFDCSEEEYSILVLTQGHRICFSPNELELINETR